MVRRRRRPGKKRTLNLRRTLFLLPNLITLSSVFCGFYSMVLSSRGSVDDDFRRAAVLIVFAMFFDILDGRVARMTRTQSAFGLQIDSLADVVSFGVAPALLIHHWAFADAAVQVGAAGDSLGGWGFWGMLACFAFVACGAIRLARFNVLSTDPGGAPTKPGKYILGLPIPGAAAVLISLVVVEAGGVLGSVRHPSVVLAVVLATAALMVSNVRFRSFKDLKLDARSVALVGFALGTSAVISTQLPPAFVLVWLLGIYVALGICESLWQITRRLAGRGDASRLLPEPAESRVSHPAVSRTSNPSDSE